jgi:hypothetical protein
MLLLFSLLYCNNLHTYQIVYGAERHYDSFWTCLDTICIILYSQLMLEKRTITLVEIENVCFTLYSYNSGTTQKTIRKLTRH